MPHFKLPPGMTADATTFDVGGAIPMGPMGGAALMPHLITIYKDIAERAAATAAFKEAARKGGMALGQAGEWFAQQYPRVAAHINLQTVPHQIPVGQEMVADGIAKIPRGQVKEPVPVVLAQPALSHPAAARNLIAHEATHVAQALGNRDTMNMYDAANELVGYHQNPFEITANMRGSAAEHMKRPMGALMQPPPTASIRAHERALNQLKGSIWDTADQRGLLLDGIKRMRAEQQPVRATVPRMIQNLTEYPEATRNPQAAKILRNYVEYRGASGPNPIQKAAGAARRTKK